MPLPSDAIHISELEGTAPSLPKDAVHFSKLKPEEPPIPKPVIPPIEENQFFRTLLAAPPKFMAMLPALPGGIDSAARALYSKVKDPDKVSFVDEFFEELSTSKLTQIGMEGGQAVADFFDVPLFPKRTGNQIADILGSFAVPVPMGFLGGPAAKGLTGAIGKATTLLSPAVRLGEKGSRLGKPFQKRLATSLGVGTAVDQGIRALVDQPAHLPLMFSKEALTGIGPDDPVHISELLPAGAIHIDELVNVPGPNFAINDLKVADEAQEKAEGISTTKKVVFGVGTVLAVILLRQYIKALAKAKQPAPPHGLEPTPQRSSTMDAVNIVRNQPTIGGKIKIGKELIKNRLAITFGNQVDGEQLIAQLAKAAGVPEHQYKQLLGMGGNIEATGQLEFALVRGIMPDGTRLGMPLVKMKRIFDEWEGPRKTQFLEFVADTAQDFLRTKATAADFLLKAGKTFGSLDRRSKQGLLRIRNAVRYSTHDTLEKRMADYADVVDIVRGTTRREQPGLYKKSIDGKIQQIGDIELAKSIAAGNNIPEFVQMRKWLAKYAETVLDDSVRRNVQGKAWADFTKRNFQRGEEVLYIPSQEAKLAHHFFKRMAMAMGNGTTEGKRMRTVGNLLKQHYGELEGIASPLGPFHAVTNYFTEMLAHTNRSVSQMNWMKHILGMDFDDAGKIVFKQDITDPVFKRKQALMEKMFFLKFPRYIGRIAPDDPSNQYGRLNLSFFDEKVSAIKDKTIWDVRGTFGVDDVGVTQNAFAQIGELRDALVIQYKGNYHIFGDLPPYFKVALEFDTSAMNDIAAFNRFFTKAMTAGTTGRYSIFSPFSFLYNASISSLNAALRAKGGFMEAGAEAIRVWRDGVKGAVDIMVTGISGDLAQLASHSVRTHTGFGSSNPAALKAMQTKLQARFKRSMIHDYQQQTGSIGTSGQHIVPGSENITNHLDKVAFAVSKKWGGNIMPEIVRMWDHINAGFHEGVAYGVALRKLGGTTKGKTANQLRKSKREAGDLVGNTSLQGASTVARQLSSMIPFYGPAMQGLTTVGRSMIASRKSGGTFKTVATISAVIGSPVAVEMAYNMFIDPDGKYQDAAGKWWTHKEWYLDGWSAPQRASNVIFQIPGRNPWEPVFFPMPPEIGLLRALYMDLFEVVFDLSDDESNYSMDHSAVAFTRFANVPSPILAKVFLSLVGVDVRHGLSVEGEISLVQERPLSPNRVTPNLERAQYQGGALAVSAQAIVQDFAGTLGTTGVRIYNELFGGDPAVPIEDKVAAAMGQLSVSVSQQARYISPLLKKSLRTGRGNRHITDQIYAKEQAIDRWGKTLNVLTGEMQSKVPGRTQKITQDPITIALVEQIPAIRGKVKILNEEIARLNSWINSLQLSLVNTIKLPNSPIARGPITVEQRNDLVDGYKAEIDALEKVKLGVYKSLEAGFGIWMQGRTGRDMSGFTFDGWKDRANPDSASPTPQTSPQTSQ